MHQIFKFYYSEFWSNTPARFYCIEVFTHKSTNVLNVTGQNWHTNNLIITNKMYMFLEYIHFLPVNNIMSRNCYEIWLVAKVPRVVQCLKCNWTKTLFTKKFIHFHRILLNSNWLINYSENKRGTTNNQYNKYWSK